MPRPNPIEIPRQGHARLDAQSYRIAAMRARSEAALLAACHAPVMGIDFAAICGAARRVEFAALINDDKVCVTSESVVVHDQCARALAAGSESPEDAELLCALYVVHELAHLPQGIGPYAVVRDLRSLGEDALLDLDLGADHVAALVVSRARDMPLSAVKALQLRGLCGFPVTTEHTPEARRRKARRVVSLVVESMLGLARDDSYLCADFSPTSPALSLIYRGAGLTRVWATAPLTSSATERLLSAADALDAGGADPAEVAAIVRAALAPRVAA